MKMTINTSRESDAVGAAERPPKRKPRIRQVPAVSRAVAILRLLGDSKRPLGVKEISDNLKLVGSTCLHILRVLVDEQLVAVDPATKKYSLDFGLAALSRRMLREDTSMPALQAKLTRFAAEHDVTVTTVRIYGINRSIVVAVAYSDRLVSLNVQVGSRFPSLVSATGRCFAAYSEFNEKTLREEFGKLKWYRAPSFEAWLGEIEEAKMRGFGADIGNYVADAVVVAVPYFDHNGVMTHSVAAIGTEREVGDNIEELAAGLRKIISQVGAEQ
jgi:DNA-binding IclR family transcriptional regulator